MKIIKFQKVLTVIVAIMIVIISFSNDNSEKIIYFNFRKYSIKQTPNMSTLQF